MSSLTAEQERLKRIIEGNPNPWGLYIIASFSRVGLQTGSNINNIARYLRGVGASSIDNDRTIENIVFEFAEATEEKDVFTVFAEFALPVLMELAEEIN